MARTAARPKTPRRKAGGQKAARRRPTRYWSNRVTKESNALDLDAGVFTWNDPKRIAASLKRSAEQSHRR